MHNGNPQGRISADYRVLP